MKNKGADQAARIPLLFAYFEKTGLLYVSAKNDAIPNVLKCTNSIRRLEID